jgi:hypothetical protein
LNAAIVSLADEPLASLVQAKDEAAKAWYVGQAK